jgi:WD40 repeat protein
MQNTPNPYVGPRSFDYNETLYGRDRELKQLLPMLIAERIVLMQSPSGAGKTSLLKAGLVPLLHKNEFNVLPMVRVNHDLPEGTPRPENYNRYSYSTILSLEENIPHEQRLTPETIATLTLDDYLNQRPLPANGFTSNVLIFDQFEEVLTIAPNDRAGKEAFFSQLGAALRNRDRWALFSMRDDYVGAIQPYQRPIPNRFDVIFRLERLGTNAAKQAIQNPLQKIGFEFEDKATQKLIDDLRSTQVQLPSGAIDTQLGLFVEPVQLQVVCYRLWDTLHDDHDKRITEQDLQNIKGVDQALADYYANCVEQAASINSVEERLIRRWFNDKLISKDGIRLQVLRRETDSDGLPNSVVDTLENFHIIRSEKRAGLTWLELSHDRLIDPVHMNNTDWFEQHLSLLQRQAIVWWQQNRPKGLLLRDKALLDAEEDARTKTLDPIEKEFLDECRLAHAAEERDRRNNRLIRIALVAAGIFAVFAVVFGFSAYNSSIQARTRQNEAIQAKSTAEVAKDAALNAKATADIAKDAALNAKATADIAKDAALSAKAAADVAKADAEEKAREALAKSMAAEALGKNNSDHINALWLAVQATINDPSIESRNALFDVVQFTPYKRLFGHKGPVSAVAYSAQAQAATYPKGIIATGGCLLIERSQCSRGEIIIWDIATQQIIKTLEGEFGQINALAFNSDGSLLAAGGCFPRDESFKGCEDSKGQIILWDTATWEPKSPVPSGDRFQNTEARPFKQHLAPITTLAFSPGKVNGIDLLASGSLDKRIYLWNISKTDPKKWDSITQYGIPASHSSFVNDIAFSPTAINGRYFLASAGEDRLAILWQVPFGSIQPPCEKNDNVCLEAAKNEKPAIVNSVEHSGPVSTVAFSLDSAYLFTGSFDRTIKVLDIKNNKRLDGEIRGQKGFITSLAVGPVEADGSYHIASVGFDQQVILWRVTPGNFDVGKNINQAIEQDGHPLRIHDKAINDVIFTGNSQELVSVSDDKTIAQWNLAAYTPISQPNVTLSECKRPDENLTSISLANGYAVEAQPGSNTLIILDKNKQEIDQLTEHFGPINSLALSQSGIFLASASDDQTVIIWQIQPDGSLEQYLAPLSGHSAPVKSVFFCHDYDGDGDDHLISVDSDNNYIEWKISLDVWKNTACKSIQANASPQQLNAYFEKYKSVSSEMACKP